MTRSRNLADYDGAPLRSATLPHPVELSRWQEAGLIRIDVDADRLVLTDAGRAAITQKGVDQSGRAPTREGAQAHA